MKRFFQPVQKEGSSKKPSLLVPTQEEEEEKEGSSKKEPLKFMTWNANNWPEFTNFVTTSDPDVIALQVPPLTPPPLHYQSLVFNLSYNTLGISSHVCF